MMYRLMKGDVIDLSDPALFNQEDLAFLIDLQHRAFWEGESHSNLRLSLAGGAWAYPIWRMRQSRVTREVHETPLYLVAEDIIDRVGIRRGDVGADPDDVL